MQNLESVAQKWPSYCTRYERGHLYIYYYIVYHQWIIQSKGEEASARQDDPKQGVLHPGQSLPTNSKIFKGGGT